ncbi:MAG: response regulator transcription factor [Peptococcia bacterium]|jgi:two-component system chemotaxis response regulator CheY
MSSEQLKIVLCDDSMLVRKQLKEILTDAGVKTILEASNGNEALPLIKKHNPQIVFLDIVMPVMNGIETLKEIKKFNSTTKVIMITSSGTQTHLKTALEEGAYDFIQKPWKETQIISILDRLKDNEGV